MLKVGDKVKLKSETELRKIRYGHDKRSELPAGFIEKAREIGTCTLTFLDDKAIGVRGEDAAHKVKLVDVHGAEYEVLGGTLICDDCIELATSKYPTNRGTYVQAKA